MANPFFVQPAQYGQGLQALAGSVQQFGQQRKQEQAQQEQEAYKQAAKQAMAQAFQSGDPAAIRQAVIQFPEIAQTATQMFGFTNDQTEKVARETYRRALSETDPARQAAILEGGIETVRQFGGNPRMMSADLQTLRNNPKAFNRSARAGYAAMASDQEYEAMFGGQQDPTAFMQEMMAAGIEPGSQEYKDAVLERYGKGQTIGFDVVEAVNPDTGRNEYYQVSRTDPGNRIALGIEVPVDPRVQAAQAEQQAKQTQQRTKEMTQVDDMLDNVNQIMNSPGLEDWSGIEAFAPVIPGTEQANTDALVERLQSQQFLKNISQMRGMGALSNAEGQKVAAAAAALKRQMTDKAVKQELDRIRTELSKAKQRIESGNLLPPEERGDVVPNVNAAEGRTQADRAANAASDAGVVNWSDL